MWIFSVMRLRQKRMQGAPNPMAYGAERGWRTKLLGKCVKNRGNRFILPAKVANGHDRR